MSLDLFVNGYSTFRKLMKDEPDIEIDGARDGQHEMIIDVADLPFDVKYIKIEVSL